MDLLSRIETGFDRWIAALSRRSRWFDHLWRALMRYQEVLGGRLAAAIAYYGFFAVFALGLLAYSAFGVVIRNSARVQVAVAQFLAENLPFVDLNQILNSSSSASVAGAIILVFTGVGWVEAIRSSQRLIFGLQQQPGNIVVRWLIDLAVLLGIFVMLGASVAAIDALESLLRWLLRSTGSVGLGLLSGVLSVLVNLVLAAALMVVVPRVRISRRRLRPAILFVAIGITLLNTVGRYWIGRTERNPAYTVVAGTVALLLYLYLLNQLLLFGAAIAATSEHGRIVDLSGGRPPVVVAPPPTGPPGSEPPVERQTTAEPPVERPPVEGSPAAQPPVPESGPGEPDAGGPGIRR
ncbi:YihY/virulence factor BrkB family protein [Plantactinospora sp. KBS50]|uniref:YihY/virulence factor BrkB family protein n=1 Tax=Plantactinospora sp. KBS50 TaxID=2024580 RepID=UPI0035113B94